MSHSITRSRFFRNFAPFTLTLMASLFALAEARERMEIHDIDDLDNIRNQENKKYYFLKNDLFLNGTDWVPIGNSSKPFVGAFNGEGHFIHGLKVNRRGASGLFGVVKNSHIANLIFLQAEVQSSGTNNPAGVAVGKLQHSEVNNIASYNSSVSTLGSSSPVGGLIGMAVNSAMRDLQSDTSIHASSRARVQGGRGGIVGNLSGSYVKSVYNNGKATGPGTEGHGAGIAGFARDTQIFRAINEGDVSYSGDSAKFSKYAGGIVGKGWKVTLGKAANTATVRNDASQSSLLRTGSGGIAGYLHGSIDRVINTGEVESQSVGAVGGIAMELYNTDVSETVNMGPVHTNFESNPAGGIAGRSSGYNSLINVMNAGTVETPSGKSHNRRTAGVLAGSVGGNPIFHNTLSTGTIVDVANATGSPLYNFPESFYPHPAPSLANNTWVSPPEGATAETELRSATELPGLTPDKWNFGTTRQYPMLKRDNPLYQELMRMGALNSGLTSDYAFPDKDRSSTLFNTQLWNVAEGRKPLLKNAAAAVARASELGLDGVISCSEGGYACITDIPDLSCQQPTGIPLIDAYTSDTQHHYVVARSHANTDNSLKLIRFHQGLLDESFGECGVVLYHGFWEGISEDLIVAGDHCGKSHCPIRMITEDSAGQIKRLDVPSQPAVENGLERHPLNIVSYPDVSGYIMGNDLDEYDFIIGKSGSSSLLAGIHINAAFEEGTSEWYIADGEDEKINAIAYNKRGNKAFVAGVVHTVDGHRAFLQKHDIADFNRERVSDFGDNGRIVLTEAVDSNSSQGVAIAGGDVYLSSTVNGGKGLFIRKFARDTATRESFVVDETMADHVSSGKLFLYVSSGKLVVVKYDETHIFSQSYTLNGQPYGNRYDQVLLNARIASLRPAIGDGKVYLSYAVLSDEDSGDNEDIGGGDIKVLEIPIHK